MSVNKVILVGNVGKDPETRYLEGGTAVCKFPLATSEVYKNRDGEKITTTECIMLSCGEVLPKLQKSM